MGTACSLIAFGYAIYMHINMDNAPVSASIASVVGTFVAASLLWRWLVVKKERYSLVRGGLIGLLVGWLSLYFGYVGWLVYKGIAEEPFTAETLQALAMAVAYSLALPVFSMAIYGWLSVVLTCMLCACLAQYQKY